jgi:hypothetical protein
MAKAREKRNGRYKFCTSKNTVAIALCKGDKHERNLQQIIDIKRKKVYH